MNTLMKVTATAAALALGSTAAYANSGFGQQEIIMDDNAITLDLVVADTAGVVAVYGFSGGELGEMIGMTTVNAGANADVIINLDPAYPLNANERVVAFLFEGEDMSDPMTATAKITLDVAE